MYSIINLLLTLVLSACFANPSDLNSPLANGPSDISAESKSDGSGVEHSSLNLYTSSTEVVLYALGKKSNKKEKIKANWELQGSWGTLTTFNSGENIKLTALIAGSGNLIVKYNGLIKNIPVTVSTNAAPSITIYNPAGNDDFYALNSTVPLSWIDTDSDDSASVNIYYSTSKSSNCDGATLIASNLSEDTPAYSSQNWDTTGLPRGAYYICMTITDTKETSHFWSSTPIYIDGEPVLNYTHPVGNDDSYTIGDSFNITWTDDDPDDSATFSLYYTSGLNDECNSGTLITSGLSEDADGPSDQFNFNTTGMPSGKYHICAYIDDSIARISVPSGEFIVSNTCSWTGAVDNDWNKSGNWNSCQGGIPGSYDFVFFDATGGNPTITANAQFYGVKSGGINKVITINSGVSLVINQKDETIMSDIEFKGQTDSCSDCIIEIPSFNLTITNAATLTLGKGLKILTGTYTRINIGKPDQSSEGHIVINSSGIQSEKVKIFSKSSTNTFHGIHVIGTASNKSSTTIDGLSINNMHDFAATHHNITFFNYYEILKLDNIDFNNGGPASGIITQNCATATITNTNWDGLQFNKIYDLHESPGFGGSNIKYQCTTTINLTNWSGLAGGPTLEYDPGNKLNWANDTSFDCLWNGSSDTNWHNPSNWSNCTNSRNNYPDILDTVEIPIAPINQPVVSNEAAIKGFKTATGGGTITIDHSQLSVFNHILQHDISFNPVIDDCTDCIVNFTKLDITGGKTLTLNNSVSLQVRNGAEINVGFPVSYGHFKTTTTDITDKNKWPRISDKILKSHTGFNIRGVNAGQRSSVDIQGMRSWFWMESKPMFNFLDFYEIKNFDSIISSHGNGGILNDNFINLDNCANSLITDANWDRLSFHEAPGVGKYNISAKNCSGLGANYIQVTPLDTGGPGYGNSFEDDADGVINWN